MVFFGMKLGPAVFDFHAAHFNAFGDRGGNPIVHVLIFIPKRHKRFNEVFGRDHEPWGDCLPAGRLSRKCEFTRS